MGQDKSEIPKSNSLSSLEVISLISDNSSNRNNSIDGASSKETNVE
jgi:hypothetical protein